MMKKTNTVKDIREEFVRLIREQEFVIDKSGVKTVEIVNASFLADENAIFGTPDYDYIRREIDWYNSESLNVYDIEGPQPKIWISVASNMGYINSNYGWCIFSYGNNHQYKKCLNTLREHLDSRQAIMIYTCPYMHEKSKEWGKKDFMCTNTVQYLYRQNMLHAIVSMRSNDAWFGYRNDYAWQAYVLEKISNELNVMRGSIFWNAGSLHIYEPQFKHIK